MWSCRHATRRCAEEYSAYRLVVALSPPLRRRSGLVCHESFGIEARKSAGASIACSVVQLFLDTQQLVVLGHPLGPSRSTALDLATVGCHREVGDGRVLGLAGTVTHHAGVPSTV